MALPQTPNEWLVRLALAHDADRPRLKVLNDEYELQSPRSYMHPDVLREIGDRLQQVVIAWPQLVVDSVEERLDVEGFRLPDQTAADDDLWRVWQENNLDEFAQLGRVDALVMSRSYLCVGAGTAPDTPLITCESPLEMYADIDPRDRSVRAALRRWIDPEATPTMVSGTTAPIRGAGTGTEYATLYLPDSTHWYENGVEIERDEHGLGAVPVVPLVNRSRLADYLGRSELAPILPIARAANKIATDMMVAAEFVALPQRGIFGIGPDDLEDAQGNKQTAMTAYLGRLLLFPPGDEQQPRQFEFASANLANFHDTINQLARLTASIAGLPPHYLGLTTENPPSADSIRSAEMRLVKRAERKQVPFGGSYETVMRLVKRLQDGDWNPKYRRLETIWRDPSTPTIAQKSDAVVKLYSTQPKPILPLPFARRDMGYTDAQIALMEAEDKKQAAQDPLTALTAELAGRSGQAPSAGAA